MFSVIISVRQQQYNTMIKHVSHNDARGPEEIQRRLHFEVIFEFLLLPGKIPSGNQS